MGPAAASTETKTAPLPRAARRGTLSRQVVLEAALRVVDAEGLEALNMRRLGAELSVDPMSIYNHVRSKDALLDGIVDLLWEDIPAPPNDGDWVEQLRVFTRSLRALMRGHPHAAPLVLRRMVLPEPALRAFQARLGILRRAGFETERAAEILRTLFSYGAGYALAELTCLCLPGAQQPAAPLSEREILVGLGQMLPPGTSPDLVETAIVMHTGCDADVCFETGLDLILQGLARLAPKRPRTRRRGA